MNTNPLQILLVDDEQLFRHETKLFLEEFGHYVGEALSGEQAIIQLAHQDWDVALLDLALPGLSGLDVLRHIHTHSPHTLVIVITAFASLDSAVEALRLGAFDYLSKPLRFEDLSWRLEKLSQHRALLQENQALKHWVREHQQFGEIIGESPAMQALFGLIRQLEQSLTTVLIQGESGVGKELVARAVHEHSPAHDKPFIPVNVGAIPASMLESQLFGHRKGAFTGAIQHQRGIFQAAQGGTVFLDEIGELPLTLQPKLLRALEQKEVFPLGAEQPVQASFRLLSATNRDLEAMVKVGDFRADLYYRLNVFTLDVPPLRARHSDIPLLAQHFVSWFASTMKKQIQGIAREAIQLLLQAPWPGNVRELRNTMERAVILANSPWITKAQLPHHLLTSNAHHSLVLKDVLDASEKQHIHHVLQLTHGNKEEAAHQLGLSLATLYRRLEKHDLL